METIRKIRLALSKGMGIREAARKFNKARKTIRKIARSEETRFTYHRKEQQYPVLGDYIGALESLLEINADLTPTAEPPRRAELCLPIRQAWLFLCVHCRECGEYKTSQEGIIPPSVGGF